MIARPDLTGFAGNVRSAFDAPSGTSGWLSRAGRRKGRREEGGATQRGGLAPLTRRSLKVTVPACARPCRQAHRQRSPGSHRLVAGALGGPGLSVPWPYELGNRRLGPDRSVRRPIHAWIFRLPAHCCHVPAMRFHGPRQRDHGWRPPIVPPCGYSPIRDLVEPARTSACYPGCCAAIGVPPTRPSTDGSHAGTCFPCASLGVEAVACDGGGRG